MKGVVVAIAVAVLTVVATPTDLAPASTPDDAQVMGQVEVRERESSSSDGRSTSPQDPALGLSEPAAAIEAPAPTATLFAVGSTPSPSPTASVVPALVEPETPAAPTTTPVAPAIAPTPVPSEVPTPTPAPPPQNDGGLEEQALAMISYPWGERLPGWSIEFLESAGGVRGLTYSAELRIEIFVRPADTAWDIARVIAHELGHAVDLTHNDTGLRRSWREQRGIDREIPWWPESGAADFATGAGDFAECFATWQVGSTSLSQIAGPCSADDLALIASLS